VSPEVHPEAAAGLLFVQQVFAKRVDFRQTPRRHASIAAKPVDFCGLSDKKRSRKRRKQGGDGNAGGKWCAAYPAKVNVAEKVGIDAA